RQLARWSPLPRSGTNSSAAAIYCWTSDRKEGWPMSPELPLFGALAPSALLYFLASILVFVVVDRVVTRLGAYRLFWHPPLARFGLFLCVFSLLVLATKP